MSNSWEFHMRNMTSNRRKVEARVHHAGGAKVPWHDGRPACWEKDIVYNPDGGHDSVYVPNDFVAHFSEWVKVIIDGLKLVKDIGIFIASEGADEEALVNALQDIFDLSKDTIKAELAKCDEDIDALVKNAKASFEKACKSIGADPKYIKKLASHISGSDDWAFIAGNTYIDYIHDSSDITGKHGWSIFIDDKYEDDERDGDKQGLQIAHHAFIYKGHLFYVYDDDGRTKLWSHHW